MNIIINSFPDIGCLFLTLKKINPETNTTIAKEATIKINLITFTKPVVQASFGISAEFIVRTCPEVNVPLKA